MDKFFRTYFRWFQAGFVVLAALLLAASTNGIVASFLVPWTLTIPEAGASAGDDDEDNAALSAPTMPPDLFGRAEPPPEAENRCADVTCAEGEICNPTSGICEPAPQAVAEEPEAAADGRCTESDIALTLVGTMVSENNPEYTIAVFRNPATNRTQFGAVGSVLLTEATITGVHRHRVDITRNGRAECIRTGDRAARQAANPTGAADRATGGRPAENVMGGPSPTEAPPVAAAGSRSPEERILTDIQRGEDGSYNIPRDLVQEVARDEALLRRQAPQQIAPHYENGQPAGISINGVPSSSMFARIGLRNGDVIRAVNGSPITTPQQAAGMYDAMLNETSVSITVMRRNREQTLRYNLQ